MVPVRRREPATEHELRDAVGREIGHVLRPAGPLRFGLGAETVLLVRSAPSAIHPELSSAA